MKMPFPKIAVVGTYAFLPSGAAMHGNARTPQGDGTAERVLMLAGETLRSGLESFGAFLQAFTGMAEPAAMASALLWSVVTGCVVLAALWLGRANLAPLH